MTTSDSDSESDSSDYEGLTEKEKREMIDMKMALMLQQEEIELGHSMYDMVRRRRSKDAEKEENERKIAQIKRQLDELRVSENPPGNFVSENMFVSQSNPNMRRCVTAVELVCCRTRFEFTPFGILGLCLHQNTCDLEL